MIVSRIQGVLCKYVIQLCLIVNIVFYFAQRLYDFYVRNVDILKDTHMYPMAEFLREKRLRWFEHVQRRDKDETTKNILQTTVDGKRNRGRPKLRWRDLDQW